MTVLSHKTLVNKKNQKWSIFYICAFDYHVVPVSKVRSNFAVQR